MNERFLAPPSAPLSAPLSAPRPALKRDSTLNRSSALPRSYLVEGRRPSTFTRAFYETFRGPLRSISCSSKRIKFALFSVYKIYLFRCLMPRYGLSSTSFWEWVPFLVRFPQSLLARTQSGFQLLGVYFTIYSIE